MSSIQKKIGYIFVSILILFSISRAHTLYARRWRGALSTHKFEKMIDAHALVVALFYDDSADDETNENTKNVMKSVSKRYTYKRAGVRFIHVNIAKRKTASLLDEYDLTQLPIILLFEDGSPVKTTSRSRVKLTKPFSKKGLRQLIDTHFEKRIDEIIEEKEQEEERKARERSYAYSYYGGPYYGYGYYPYGYGSGIGFGHRRSYRGYHRGSRHRGGGMRMHRGGGRGMRGGGMRGGRGMRGGGMRGGRGRR